MINPTNGRSRAALWLGRLTLVALLAAALPTNAQTANADSAAQRPAAGDSSMSRCSTGYLTHALHLPHVAVDSAVPETTGSYTPPGATAAITGLPTFCAVDLTRTDSAGNPVHIAVWLPAKWNGRFQGIGGGGYSCGIFYATPPGYVSPSLEQTLKVGYASVSTDWGVPPADANTGSWALKPDGQLNTDLISDFASASIHDMTVAGKAVTQAFYGDQIRYAYFNGCSTGGREGLMEAQQYPTDYNGIVSGSPAINWTSWVPAAIWPALVMNQTHHALPTCKQDAFTAAAVKACDPQDGVTDGIISDPVACDWNANKLIGQSTPCGTITAADATVMNKIWQGPVTARGRSLWFGLVRGASPAWLAATTTTDGVTEAVPLPHAVGWLGTWLKQNPNWDWKTLTFTQYDQLFAQSLREFSSTIATDDPDLSRFNGNGGKILLWHGLADPIIPPQGSIRYYQRVQQATGGAAKTRSFARLFLAPGADHCASAAGPTPTDPLAAIVAWVEHGQAPQSIPATLTDPATGAQTLSRPVCAYPLVARYTGRGSTTDARNFACAPTYQAR
ncbi:feruloyl esterase [Asanoa ferruginea]|uniref:Feruloyl esterase n=1 Tax=Asanoa ferruginea TaxID=53367 RepID=A0A3D9ZPB4_9ACTN|nr:tannase/feruloyl esterase family alpha/beta hydrolase [Asanoa ferruginea]REF99208.1 feruloyl esterase [Asanoa ferruginea]GIF45802.1 tannase [Asanoa ferruginea]